MDSFLKTLSVKYFQETSKKVLDKYLIKYGFKLLEANQTKITYKKDNIFLEIYYYPEDIPNYYLMIGIGFVQKDNGSLMYDGMGLWYALSQNSHDYKHWNFSSQEELERNLAQICNDVLEKYAKSLWENPDKLRSLIDAQLNRVKEDDKEKFKSQRLLKAKQAFKAEQYNEALRIFEEVGVNNLSTVELQMYNRCRKKLDLR